MLFLCLIFNIFIKKFRPLTSSQRFKKGSFLLKFDRFKKFFKLFCKNKAGRNNQGVVTTLSKGLKRKRNSSFIGVTRWDSRFFVHMAIIRSGKKLISINKHICGSLSIQPYINGMLIGQYSSFSNLPQKF